MCQTKFKIFGKKTTTAKQISKDANENAINNVSNDIFDKPGENRNKITNTMEIRSPFVDRDFKNLLDLFFIFSFFYRIKPEQQTLFPPGTNLLQPQ